jgi:hypothetical protein
VVVDETLNRRIRAAIALKGYRGVSALSKDLGANWGQDKLYEVLAGKKDLPEPMLREIARLCEVPYAFFDDDLDFSRSDGQPPTALTQLDRIEENQRQLDWKLDVLLLHFEISAAEIELSRKDESPEHAPRTRRAA